jgi:flagellar biogenesis protein FliO
MWVPHGAVGLGFALMLLVAAWGLVRMVRRTSPADGEAKP